MHPRASAGRNAAAAIRLCVERQPRPKAVGCIPELRGPDFNEISL